MVASSLPLGLNATADTPPRALVTWMGAPEGWPVAGFHSRTVLPAPGVASSLPSGLNATPQIAPVAPTPIRMGALTGWWVRGFHVRTAPLPPTLASSLPLGLNAAAVKAPWAPVWRGAPAGAERHPISLPWVWRGATSDTPEGSVGKMPFCCCPASNVVMAALAWPVGKIRQAATASRRAITGLMGATLRPSAAARGPFGRGRGCPAPNR